MLRISKSRKSWVQIALKWGTVICLASVCSFGRADRLFQIPVGKKVPFRALKVQHIWDADDSDSNRTIYTAGIGVSFEIAVTTNSNFDSEDDSVFDLSYSVTDPLVDYGPGITVGMRDIANRTQEGRYAFFALTFRQGQSGIWNGENPAEGTVALKYGAHGPRLMLGGYVPLATFLAVIAEIDYDQTIAGLEFNFMKDLELRWLHRPGKKFYSASYQIRF